MYAGKKKIEKRTPPSNALLKKSTISVQDLLDAQNEVVLHRPQLAKTNTIINKTNIIGKESNVYLISFFILLKSQLLNIFIRLKND